MEPVHLSQLLSATRGTAVGTDGDVSFRRVSTDSRELARGDLFWAIRGPTHDGHQFVPEAVKKGAALCVVDQRHGAGLSGPLVVVDETLPALGDFARWYRHQRESLVIGVTGSVGKTTTREMIYAVLSSRHSGIQSCRNFNNEVGLPLSLLELKTDDEFGLFEMGAARVGDIRALCEIACPEVGVITKIGPAHLETFGDLDQVFLGKGELLDALPSHGFAVIGGDDERMRALQSRAACSTILVGEKQGNHLRATDVEVKPQRLRFTVDRRKYEVPATGRHYLTAALCAVAVAREIGMEAGAIATGLLKFAGQPGRCRPERLGMWTVIDDTYNANPASMQAACLCLRDWPAEHKKLFVAGDMLELGAESSRFHQELGAEVAAVEIDHLLTFGEQAEQVARGAFAAGMSRHRVAACHDFDALVTVLDCWLEPGDVVLIKGSRGMRMERVMDWLKQRTQQEAREHQTRAATRAVA